MIQYIGARYVPIFYQNSQDPTSSLWENNVTYEPLTWVELANGHMYISKKTVPTSVGSPVDNPEYWLEAGQYNAYIQSLQDQIDDMNDGSVSGSLQNQINTLSDTDTSLQNQINDMNDGSVSGSLQDQINDMKDGSISGSLQDQINDIKDGSISGSIQNQLDIIKAVDDSTVIFIGDSYGVDASVGGDSWSTLISAVYPNSAYLILGGTGFTSDLYISTNYLGMLTEHVNTLTSEQKKKIKQIVVIGGANDANLLYNGTATYNVLVARINSFCDYVKNNLPNAIIKCAFVGWYLDPIKHPSYNSARDAYAHIIKTNYAYYKDGENILKMNSYIRSDDLVHPTVEASLHLAWCIASIITNGNTKFAKTVTSVTYSAITGQTPQPTVSNIASGGISSYFDGDTCQVTIRGAEANHGCWNIQFPAGTTINPGQSGELIRMTGVPIGAIDPAITVVPVEIWKDGGVYLGTRSFIFAIQGGKLAWRYQGHDAINMRDSWVPMLTLNINLRHS